MGIKKQKNAKNIWIAAAGAFCILALMPVCYFFQHESVVVGNYTVVYYKNQCDIDPEDLPADFNSLTALPCLIRINWRERIASDLEQEYSYLPGRGTEKTRLIHKSSKE
ncbi:MAG: hypothetical protein CVU71_01845 [Deltaproteobacteria bacterium HGW-Deltaproteobacteria-6]|jgi:hypothetical protein|nr:MAG: hypothetical protein CVU71_01845 [Deltaproteobacteria bacterium HGW-Deltaproteobacteria-6]